MSPGTERTGAIAFGAPVSALTTGYRLAVSVVIGALLPLQTRITGVLGERIGDGMIAAWLTSFVGLVLAGVLALLLPSARRAVRGFPSALRSRAFPRWALLAGLIAAYFVVAQGVVASVTGVALFTISFVAGQTLGSIAIDRWGIGPAGRRPITVWRLAGTAIVLCAALLTIAPSAVGIGAENVALLLPFVAGILNGLQTIMNGLQTAHYRSFVPATLLNFAVGLIALGVVLLAKASLDGGWPTPPADAWMYLGGPLGVVIVGGAATLVRHLGALLTSLGMVAGQLIGAVVLDITWPAAPQPGFPWLELSGTLLALIGVGVASVPRTGSGAAGRKAP